MASIYVFGFVMAFITLGLWFGAPKDKFRRIFQLMLLTSLGLYGLSIAGFHAPLTYKMQTLFRDLLFLGVFGAAFSRLAGWKKSFWLGFGVSILALFWFSKGFLNFSFPYHENIPLDKQGELLIELKEGRSIGELHRWTQRYGLTYKRAFYPKQTAFTDLDNYYTVDVPEGKIALIVPILYHLQHASAVSWGEENEIIQIDPMVVSPIPAKLPSKFGINDPGIENLWGFERMQMDKLYNLLEEKKLQPQKKALIAILDTGVDGGHEDLKANFKSTNTSYDYDKKGHGTHCAGIAGAVSNNGVGVASFSRDNRFTTITSIKVLTDAGFGTQQTIIDGMLKAADNGADVISMSLGGRTTQASQRAYDKAVQYAVKAGAIVVAAAGNSNRNATEFSPVNSKGAIGVSAVDADLNRADFSNTVNDLSMGVAAPGVGIYSTIPGNQYATYSGTSMATPYVAGLLGLLKSLKPDLKTEEAYKILNETGMDTRNSTSTGKFIQPYQAVKRLLNL
jgi:thermitase